MLVERTRQRRTRKNAASNSTRVRKMTDYFVKADSPPGAAVSTPALVELKTNNANMRSSQHNSFNGSRAYKAKISTALKAARKQREHVPVVDLICIDDTHNDKDALKQADANSNSAQKENVCPSGIANAQENTLTPVLMDETPARHSPRLRATSKRTPAAETDTQAKGTASLKIPRCRVRTAISTESPTPTAARSLSYSAALDTSTPADKSDDAQDSSMERRRKLNGTVATGRSVAEGSTERSTRKRPVRTTTSKRSDEFAAPARVGRPRGRPKRTVKRESDILEDTEKGSINGITGKKGSTAAITLMSEKSQDSHTSIEDSESEPELDESSDTMKKRGSGRPRGRPPKRPLRGNSNGVDNSDKERINQNVDKAEKVTADSGGLPGTVTSENSQNGKASRGESESEPELEEHHTKVKASEEPQSRNTSRTRRSNRSTINNKGPTQRGKLEKVSDSSVGDSVRTTEDADDESTGESAAGGSVIENESDSISEGGKASGEEGDGGSASSSTLGLVRNVSKADQAEGKGSAHSMSSDTNKGTTAKKAVEKPAAVNALLNRVESNELVGDQAESADSGVLPGEVADEESALDSEYVSAEEHMSDTVEVTDSNDVSAVSALDETVIADDVDMADTAVDAADNGTENTRLNANRSLAEDLAQKDAEPEAQADAETSKSGSKRSEQITGSDELIADTLKDAPRATRSAGSLPETDECATNASDAVAAAMLSMDEQLAKLDTADATASDNDDDDRSDDSDDDLNVSLSRPNYLRPEELERLGMSASTSTTATGGRTASNTTGRRSLRSQDHPQIKPLTSRGPLSTQAQKNRRKSRISIDNLLASQKWRRDAAIAEYNVDETSRTSFNFDEFEKEVDKEDQATNTAAVYQQLGQNSGKDTMANTVIKQALDMNAGALEDKQWEGETFFTKSSTTQFGVVPDLHLLDVRGSSTITSFLSSCKDWETVGVILSAYDFRLQCGRMDTLSCVYLTRWLVGVVARSNDSSIAARATKAVRNVLHTFKDNLAGKLSILVLARECFAVFGMEAKVRETEKKEPDVEPKAASANKGGEQASSGDFPLLNFKHFLTVLSSILQHRHTAIPSTDSLELLKLLLRAAMDRQTHSALPELTECLHQLLITLPDKETEIVNTMRAVTTNGDASVFLCSLLPWAPFMRRIRARYALSHSLRYFMINKVASRTPQPDDTASDTKSTDNKNLNIDEADGPKYDNVSLKEVVLALEKVRITPTTDYRMLHHAMFHLSLALDHSQVSEDDQRIISYQSSKLPGKIKDMQGKFPLRTKIKDILILLEIWIGQWRPNNTGQKKRQKTLKELMSHTG